MTTNFIDRATEQTVKKLEIEYERKLTAKEKNKIRAHFIETFEQIWESEDHEKEE